MDWKVVLSTLTVVFLAELGDKTQLSTMVLASSKKDPLAVFFGSAIALILSSAIGVFVGDTFGKFIPPNVIRYAAGGLFVAVGGLMLLGRV